MAGTEARNLDQIRFEECLKCFKDTTDREPQILPCLHGFCKECIQYRSSGEDTEVSCPTCESAWPSEAVHEHWFIKKNSTNSTEKAKCSSCDENVTATSYCKDCSDTLCADCVAAHQRVKLTKDHQIVDSTDESNWSKQMCHQHNDKTGEAFCTDCNRFVCSECIESDHKQHSRTDVESAFSHVKNSLSQQINQLQEMRENSGKQLDELKASLKDVSNTENKFREDLKEFTIRIGKLLRETASQLMTNVGTVCKLQRKDIIKCTEELEMVLDETSHLTRFLQSAVEQGSEKALLAASRTIHERCCEAKERETDAKAGAAEAIAPLQLEFTASAGLERLVSEMGFAVSGKQRLAPSQTGVSMFQALRHRTVEQVEAMSEIQTNGKPENGNGTEEDRKDGRGDATPPMESTDLDLKVLSGEVLMDDPIQDKYNFSKQHEDDDPYEDYCSVCHDGGDLLCCDGADCNRVYHLQCHVPALDNEPDGLWECTMCTSVEKYKEAESPTAKKTLGITENEIRMAERMLLELYCHPNSQIFHLPVPRATHNYFKIITQPMDFSTIRQKLGTQSFNHYHQLDEFVLDLKLIFDNCITFNGNDSSLGKAANMVRAKLSSLLKSITPHLLPLLSGDESPPAKRPRTE